MIIHIEIACKVIRFITYHKGGLKVNSTRHESECWISILLGILSVSARLYQSFYNEVKDQLEVDISKI